MVNELLPGDMAFRDRRAGPAFGILILAYGYE